MTDPTALTLHEAAEALGVHYMTAYRYVRTGRLAAQKDGDRWWVSPAALDVLARREAAPAARGRATDYPRRLRERLVAGDEPGAWAVIEGAMVAGTSPAEAGVQIIGPALAVIGDHWETGQLTVAHEHRASAIAQRIVGRLGASFARPGRKRGTIVLGVVELDRHGLPVALLGDVLRGAGYDVTDLGADTPVECFVQTAVQSQRLLAVGLSATVEGNEGSMRSTLDALRDADLAVPILVGGRAIPSMAAARALGADGWASDALAAVGAFDDAIAVDQRSG